MDAVAVLRQALKNAHQFLEGTMADVTEEQLHWTPPGIANPLGATYAHLVFSEDLLLNGMLRQDSAPLLTGAWADKTGTSEPMPQMNAEWEHYGEWTRRVRIDLPTLRDYAQAVYQNTDDYLAGLSDSDLDRESDLSSMGLGTVNHAWLISEFLIGHTNQICGEISALKGAQGAKGYPF